MLAIAGEASTTTEYMTTAYDLTDKRFSDISACQNVWNIFYMSIFAKCEKFFKKSLGNRLFQNEDKCMLKDFHQLCDTCNGQRKKGGGGVLLYILIQCLRLILCDGKVGVLKSERSLFFVSKCTESRLPPPPPHNVSVIEPHCTHLHDFSHFIIAAKPSQATLDRMLYYSIYLSLS